MPRSLPALVIAVVLSACVQQSGVPTTDGVEQASSQVDPATTTTLGRLGMEQATLEFGSCMIDHGIDTPDIRLDAQGRPVLDDLGSAVDTSTPAFRTALTECASILTRVGALDLRRDPELQAAIVSDLELFSECVRNEGVETFPDPDPAFSGVGSPFPSDEVPFTDPGFEAAVATCQESLDAMVFGDE